MELSAENKALSIAWPRAIATVTLIVDDLAATKQFYVDVFGLPIVYEDSECSVFQFENTLINLLRASAGAELLAPMSVADRQAGSRFVFTINVDNCDETCAELASRKSRC